MRNYELIKEVATELVAVHHSKEINTEHYCYLKQDGCVIQTRSVDLMKALQERVIKILLGVFHFSGFNVSNYSKRDAVKQDVHVVTLNDLKPSNCRTNYDLGHSFRGDLKAVFKVGVKDFFNKKVKLHVNLLA